MAGNDYRLRIGFVDHPKVEKLVRLLGDGALRNLLRLFEYAALNRPDGNLVGLTSEDLEMVARWSTRRPGKLVEALLKVGFLDGNDSRTDENQSRSFQLHDWCEHQPFLASYSERSERAKKAAQARWNATSADAGGKRDECAEHETDVLDACAMHAERNALFLSSPSISPPTQGALAPEGISNGRSRKRKGLQYSPEFEKAFSLYPPKPEGHSKSDAYRAWQARIAAGATSDELIAGVERYAAYVRASGTTMIKMASTFFGPGEHWKLPWAFAGSRTNGVSAKASPLPRLEDLDRCDAEAGAQRAR